MGLRTESSRFGRALDLLAVFIAAGDEHHRLPPQPLVACHRIAGKRCVGTAEMGAVVDVIEGGGERVSHPFDPTERRRTERLTTSTPAQIISCESWVSRVRQP